ncbi:MAG: TonB-dependent receptor [Flavobacteriales bacterium]|jgi:outer membrane receptor protein involved in Fe transport|nr:TonB-dependent receptor [Flavobacteriales bacterium]MBT7481969.1 TonB-dependent receptor [Flavobacteriales bacterium]
MRKILSIVLLFASFSISLSQSVSGIVKDEKTKEPLIGVNVILSNTNGTTTNINGEFNVEVKNGENTITFKYIGYETIVKDIAGKSKFDIKMKSVSQQIGTVVISAGKFEQKIEEITVSMEVINPSLIENKNTTNIQTAMEQVPGVNITDGQANIRGGSGWSYGAGSRVLVMVDDMPLISGDAGQVQWKLIATENINQVEVIKGASSALYGSSALNGVINIRTAFPKLSEIEKHPSIGYTKITTHFGVTDHAKRDVLNWWGDNRQQFYGTEFSHSRKIDNLDLTIGGNYFKDEGYRKGETTDRLRWNLNSRYKSKQYTGLSYGVNANFLYQTTGSAIIWNGLDQAYIPLNNEITNTNGDTYNIDPFIQYVTENNTHNFKTRYLKVINDNSTNGQDDAQDNESETFYSDYQWQHNFKTITMRLTTGTTNEIVLARSDLFQGNNYRQNHSLYTQLDKKWNKVNLSLGTRYEYFKVRSEQKYLIDGDSINEYTRAKPVFRAGLNYQIAKATYLRTSWGQGFRFPSMAEMFISTNYSGLEIYPNPELKPESGWSAEIAVKQGMKIRNWMGYFDAAAFIMEYDDMMEFSFGQWESFESSENPGYGFKSVNVGETKISGLEFSLSGQGKLNEDLIVNILGGYTYMNPISLDTSEVYAQTADPFDPDSIIDITYANSSSDPSVLKYRYHHIAKLDIELIYKKFSLGSSYRYNDFMKNIDAIFASQVFEATIVSGINEAREKFKNGDFIVDIRTSYQFNDITKISLVINNLLNREYMSRPANMMPPRTIAIQCNMKI